MYVDNVPFPVTLVVTLVVLTLNGSAAFLLATPASVALYCPLRLPLYRYRATTHDADSACAVKSESDLECESDDLECGFEGGVEATAKAMAVARDCEAAGLSPGAGLATAEEQADAAYADLINTSLDQRGIELSSEEVQRELQALARGGKMWEEGSTSERSKGLLGNLKNVFDALSGGAHIEKNEFGET